MQIMDVARVHGRVRLLLGYGVLILSLAACGYDAKTPEQLRLEAKTQIGEHDYNAAEIHLKNLLRENPGDIEARWLLAEAYMWQWKMDAAAKELEKALELGMTADAVLAKLARAYYAVSAHDRLLNLETSGIAAAVRARVLAYQSLAAMRLGDGEQAQARLRRARELAPESADVQFAAIMHHLDRGDIKAVRAGLDGLQSADPYLLVQTGRLHMRLKALEEAKSHLNRALEAGARFYNAHIDLALIAMAQSDHEAAGKHLEQLKTIAPQHPAVDYLEGLLLFADQDYQQALGHFERVVNTYEEFIPAYMYLGLTHYALGNDQQAGNYIERFVNVMRSYYPLDKVRAHIRFRQGEYEQAIELLQRLREIRPEDTSVLALLGESYLRQGDARRARQVVDELLEQDPDNLGYRMNLGMLLLDTGQSEAGLAEIDRVVEAAAEPLEIQRLVALKLIDQGELDRAEKLIEAVLAESPDNSEFRELRGLVHASRDEPEAAEAAFLEALEANPEDVAALTNLAVFYMRQGRPDAAETYYRKILALDPEARRANLGLARILAPRGEAAAAEQHVEAALESADSRTRISAGDIYNQLGRYDRTVSLLGGQDAGANSARADLVLARAYIEQGNYPAAAYALDRLPAAYRDAAEYRLLRARTALAQGEFEQAAAAARGLLEQDPDNFTARMILAQTALQAGRVAAAATVIKRLRQSHPDSAEVRMLAAVIESVRGNEQGSIEYFEQLYEQLPSPRIAILLSDKYLKTGRPERAESILQERLTQEGDDLEVLAALGRLYIRREHYDRARELYRRLLDRAPDHVAALNNYAMLIAGEHPAEALRHAEKAYFMQRGNAAVKDTYNRMRELNGKSPVE